MVPVFLEKLLSSLARPAGKNLYAAEEDGLLISLHYSADRETLCLYAALGSVPAPLPCKAAEYLLACALPGKPGRAGLVPDERIVVYWEEKDAARLTEAALRGWMSDFCRRRAEAASGLEDALGEENAATWPQGFMAPNFLMA